MDAYIRPCAAFPDGLEIPFAIVPLLMEQELIEPAAADVENRHDDDYAAIYTEDTLESVAWEIEEAVRDYIAPFRRS